MNRSDDLFDFGDWNEFSFPQRSALFRLEPHGLGTASHESLLSYLIRVSYAHGVNPRLLVKYVLAEQDSRIGRIATKSFFQTLSGTINGLGLYAGMFADVLSAATARQDLRQLTMLRWKELLPHNGQGLLARRPRWCPACLHERGPGIAGTPTPLSWALESYQVCLDHHIRLEDQCHVCRARQDFLPSYPDPGYCRRCGSWLGHGSGRSDVSTFQCWVAGAVTDMIAGGTELSEQPKRDVFQKFIVTQITAHADSNRTVFCRAIGLRDFAVNGWLNKGQRPSITQFLTICHGVQVLPTEIFREDCEGGISVGTRNAGGVPLLQRRRSPRPTSALRRAWKQLIEAELTSRSPRSVSEVAKSLAIGRTCLWYWFPDLCKALSGRSRQAARMRSTLRRLEEIRVLREVIDEERRKGKLLSRRSINKALCERGLAVSQQSLRQELHEISGLPKSIVPACV